MDTWQIILNIAAVIISPIAAVLIAQKLQDRAAKRKDKIAIFETLVSFRAYGWGNNHQPVHAINKTPIIFAKDTKVIEAYKAYRELLKIDAKDLQARGNDINIKAVKLLEEMAKAVGYKADWEVFQTPYMPTGLYNEMEKEQQYKDKQLNSMGGVEQLIAMFLNNPQKQMQQQQEQPVEKKESTNGKTKNAK